MSTYHKSELPLHFKFIMASWIGWQMETQNQFDWTEKKVFFVQKYLLLRNRIAGMFLKSCGISVRFSCAARLHHSTLLKNILKITNTTTARDIHFYFFYWIIHFFTAELFFLPVLWNGRELSFPAFFFCFILFIIWRNNNARSLKRDCDGNSRTKNTRGMGSELSTWMNEYCEIEEWNSSKN